jgi:hypothetical protein
MATFYSKCTRALTFENVFVFGNLASALHEIGRDKEAVDVARQGVALDPNYAHGTQTQMQRV